MRHIMFTGGGTAGHVIPNLSLIEALNQATTHVSYIGSAKGIEKRLTEQAGIRFYPIASGKLRRYADIKNLTDSFRVIYGIFQSLHILRKEKPDLLFSKGGFVAVPPTIAAFLLRIPVIVHESDMTPGLANKLSFPFAKYICSTFRRTLKYLPKDKAVLTGPPIRPSLQTGQADKAFNHCPTFSPATRAGQKKIILVMGGSLGSVKINEAIRQILPQLLADYAVIHLCGKGHHQPELDNLTDYQQIDYAGDNLTDLLAAADLIVSRAGATAIHEFLALHKPMLLIPLSKEASRGDQLLNAAEFKANGYADVLAEEALTSASLIDAIRQLTLHSQKQVTAMQQADSSQAIPKILALFDKLLLVK